VGAGGVAKLLAVKAILLHVSAEEADALRRAPTLRKLLRVQLEDEPPIDRLPLFEQRDGRVRRIPCADIARGGGKTDQDQGQPQSDAEHSRLSSVHHRGFLL